MRGDGTLDVTANNTYTGPTTVSGIVLRLSNTAALSSGNVDFRRRHTRTLPAGDFHPPRPGSGANEVALQCQDNGGGFSAAGANRTVNLGEAPGR